MTSQSAKHYNGSRLTHLFFNMYKPAQAKCLALLGRILFAVPFIVFGVNHLISGSQMAGYVPAYVPGGVFWIYFTGLAMLAAGVSIIILKLAELASLLLGILVLIFIVTMHLPGVFNPDTMMMSLMNLMKDLSMVGAAFYISGTLSSKK